MIPLLWPALFSASFILVFTSFRNLGIMLLAAAYGGAFITHQLDAIAALPLILLAITAYFTAPERPVFLRVGGHITFIMLALLLGMHKFSGFNNYRAINTTYFSTDALPFTLYLNLDKPLAGFWILLTCPFLIGFNTWQQWLKAGMMGGCLTGVIVLGAAWGTGTVAWAPKWPESGWLWALNNLLMVTMAEEAFFRGYIQHELKLYFKRYAYGAFLAIILASLAFGLAHSAGGWQWMMLALMASAGYGVTYHYRGLQAAMLAHFILNLLHFSVFTYPRLA